MIYFISSTLIELGLDISWWFFKKGTYLLYNGIYYLVNYSKEDNNDNDIDITDSIIIIDNEEILDEIKELKEIIKANKYPKINHQD